VGVRGHCAAACPHRLAVAINRLLAAPEQLRELGVRGRAVVAPAMGWEAISQRYLRSYEALLSRRRPRAA
jgi:hypothetical protein